LRIEELEERREAVGVPVVGRRREEEPVLETRSHVADDAGNARVHGVLRGACRGGGVSFVEDEEALAGSFAEVLQERVAILGPPEELIGDDEAGVRAPGIDGEAAFLAPAADEGPVVELEV
jgi:hypothetical protein